MANAEAQASANIPGGEVGPTVGSVIRAGILGIAGAMPVASISLFVFNVLPIADSARYVVLPLLVVSAVLAFRGSPEATWAIKGFIAGLWGVAGYDAMRLPLVYAHIWPDFIPRLGGWITGSKSSNVWIGYTWRWIGDGGGISVAFFVACGLIGSSRIPMLKRHPITVSVAYGIMIWSGLIATVILSDRGAPPLFRLTPLSFCLSLLGHLIYGAILGVHMRCALAEESGIACRWRFDLFRRRVNRGPFFKPTAGGRSTASGDISERCQLGWGSCACRQFGCR